VIFSKYKAFSNLAANILIMAIIQAKEELKDCKIRVQQQPSKPQKSFTTTTAQSEVNTVPVH